MKKSFGSFLRERRIRTGMVIENFGLAEGAMSRLERGERNPTLRTLMRIAKVFGIPCWKLLKEFES